MAKKKKPEEKGGGGSWMNTYADMVTLLMCFFVMLYASSTPDETKWQYIFQSFTTSGKYINPFVVEDNEAYHNASEQNGLSMQPTASEDKENDHQIIGNETPESFDDFASWFEAASQSSAYADDISVEQISSTRIKITFQASVLFEPDRAELTDSGRAALNLMMPGIGAISDYIAGIEVTGHTAKGLSVVNDWDLSAARACSVVKYMDYQHKVESECYTPMGRAQYEPVADNDTEEGRAKNRRVELVLVRNDNVVKDTAVLQDILLYDYGINQGYVDPGVSNSNAVEQIISKLEDKYQTTIDSSGNVLGPESGPPVGKPITEIPSSALHELDEEGNIITESGDTAASPTETGTNTEANASGDSESASDVTS